MFEYLDSFRDQRTRGCFRDILRRGAVHREKKNIYIYSITTKHAWHVVENEEKPRKMEEIRRILTRYTRSASKKETRT